MIPCWLQKDVKPKRRAVWGSCERAGSKQPQSCPALGCLLLWVLFGHLVDEGQLLCAQVPRGAPLCDLPLCFRAEVLALLKAASPTGFLSGNILL